VDTYGGLHVLFNNAGIFPHDDGGDPRHPPEPRGRRVMDVNLKGVWLGCRAAVPAMLDSGGGSIVNVASFVALMGAATAQIAYTASKGGVLAMTRELAVEYARTGDPGQLDLLRGRSRRRCWPSCWPTRPGASAGWCTYPIGRFGRPEEIAKAALFLASDDSVVRDRVGPGRRRRDHRGLRDPGVMRRPGGNRRTILRRWTRVLGC
jgi:NAD(P)-dependent dehydrogenase (short-subunit alcohol dehydrogenase family)